MSLIAAFSGGKDSTAMVLRLAETGEEFRLLHTATGNDLPGVREHVLRVAEATGAELIDLDAPTLGELIAKYDALPNFRMRWCTREIKIEPCARWLKSHPGSVLAVGLRADEPERKGLYGDFASYRYPLREWNWDEAMVRDFVACSEFQPPPRTDCAACFFQRISDWQRLWLEHPDLYAEAEAWEAATGHTFRTDGRDSWPTPLAELRDDFEAGRHPRDSAAQRQLFSETQCRVCSL